MAPRVAGVELLNVLRPTVATAVYITFVAHALDAQPAWKERLALGDGHEDLAFVEEVRRRKALAGVLETASIVDTQGNPVDLSALEDDEEADDEQAEAGSEGSSVEADEQTEDAAASK